MDKIDGSYGSVAAPPLVVSICQFDFLAARCSEYGLDDFARRVRIGSLNANDSSDADLKRILIHYGISAVWEVVDANDYKYAAPATNPTIASLNTAT